MVVNFLAQGRISMNSHLNLLSRLFANRFTQGLQSVSSRSVNLLRLTLVAFSLTVLASCGGGSGGSAATAPATPTNDADAMLNPLTFTFVQIAGSPSMQEVQEITEISGAALNLGGAYMAGDLLSPSTIMCGSESCSIDDLPSIGTTEFAEMNSTPNLSFLHDSLDNANSEITNGEPFNGATLARGRLTGTKGGAPVEFLAFAGWLDGSIFGFTQVAIGASGSEQYRFIPYHIGVNSDSNPVAMGSETSATWEGATVASIKESGTFIRGDATVIIPDLANVRVNLEFDNWRSLDGQTISNLSEITYENLRTGGSGSFANDGVDELVRGRFYGTDHSEVGGYFNTMDVIGAFGGKRQPAQ